MDASLLRSSVAIVGGLGDRVEEGMAVAGDEGVGGGEGLLAPSAPGSEDCCMGGCAY
ncbi:hypothetical protein HDU67_003944, partial [Dinochytrium kinnereticum]